MEVRPQCETTPSNAMLQFWVYCTCVEAIICVYLTEFIRGVQERYSFGQSPYLILYLTYGKENLRSLPRRKSMSSTQTENNEGVAIGENWAPSSPVTTPRAGTRFHPSESRR